MISVFDRSLAQFKKIDRQFQSAGGSSPFMSLLPTKLLMNREDLTADRRDVPALLNWRTVAQAVAMRCLSAVHIGSARPFFRIVRSSGDRIPRS